MANRKILKRLKRKCSVCGKNICAIVYNNRKIRGGHYFGKIPLYRKSEMNKMGRSGAHKSKISRTWTVNVYNYDPKSYAHFEYWECPQCYWHPTMKASPIQQAAIKATLKKRKR
ncbi:MAG: hypothetical protein Q7S08_00415 [bacterium]|nr:hypothetical protein [bacterium]